MKKTIIICAMALVIHSFSQQPGIKWWYDVNDMSFGNSTVADVDSDGFPEIAFSCYRNDSSLYVLNGEDGTLLWKVNTGGCNDVAPAIFDVDQDGELEIVLPSSCVPVTYCFDAATGFIEWQVITHGSDSPPTIADIDSDGDFEILHGEFNGYVICIDGATGDKIWQITVDPDSWIQTAPVILDADSDGMLDFVVANWSFGSNHKIFAYRAHDHFLLWESDLPGDVMYHGASTADLDNDGLPELAIGSYDGHLYVLNAEDGSLYADFAFSNPGYIGAPTSIADINDDGLPEIVFFDWYKVGALTNTGELLWSYNIPGYVSSFRGAALSDVNDDPYIDVVFGTGNGHLIALNGNDGSVIWDVDLQAHFGSNEFDIDHGPVIADFDNDGFLDAFVVGGHAEYPAVQNNYGRAYAVSLENTGGPDWPMFRRDVRRTAYVPDSVPVSAGKLNSKTKPLIFPNPCQNKLTIIFRDDAGRVTITISDPSGRVAYSGESSERTVRINTAYLPAGVYYLRIGSDKLLFTEKIIRKR